MKRSTSGRRGTVHTLIDAHNLIYAEPRLRRLMPRTPLAREALALLLRGYPHLHIICDGGPGGRPDTTTIHGVGVEYAGKVPADDCIIAWLRARPHLRCVVVTDDRALARQVATLGATVVACQAFLSTIDHPRPPADDGRRAPPPPHEVQEWMKLFGLGDEHESG